MTIDGLDPGTMYAVQVLDVYGGFKGEGSVVFQKTGYRLNLKDSE